MKKQNLNSSGIRFGMLSILAGLCLSLAACGDKYGGAEGKGALAFDALAMKGSGASDARLKTNIELIGKSPSGINIYSFQYVGSDETYQGVLAQEVPWASHAGADGFLRVDYEKLDVEFKRLD